MKDNLLLPILVNAFFTFNLIIFGPLELYLNNLNEFWFPITDILWVIIICGILVFSILMVLCSLLKGKAHIIAVTLIFSLGLGFYFQGNILNVNYGVLDGTVIDWDEHDSWAIINTIIWAFCAFVPLIILRLKNEAFKKIMKYGSLLVIIIEVLTLGILFINTDFTEKNNSYYSLTEEKTFELSSSKNIVVFVLDAFDADLFNEIINQDIEYQDTFTDFTWFANTLGGATRTKIALPYILTGEVYTMPLSYTEYIKHSYEKTPLYRELKKNQYDTRILTSTMFVDPNQSNLIDNISLTKPKVNSYVGLAYYLYKFTGFRYMPHVLKPAFWMYTGEFDQLKETNSAESSYVIDDPKFYSRLFNRKITTINRGNCFRLYHLMGAHAPYTMNENAIMVKSADTSDIQQAQGALYIVKEYINQLKELGIYDNTNIIVMADHGLRGMEQNPLLLVKQSGKTKRFSISQAPISYKDLQPTLLSFLTEDYSLYGRMIFEIPEDEKRQRYFYFDDSSNNEINIIEYKSMGHASDADSLMVNNVYHGNSKINREEYTLGTLLSFGLEANGNQYCVSGFSKNEGTHTWTDGQQAFLTLPMHDKNFNILMQINFSPFLVPGKLDQQRIKVSAGEQELGEWVVTKTGNQSKEIIIPKTLLKDSKLKIELDFPDAASPQQFDLSSDSRMLGIAISSITFDKADSIELDSLISFDKESNTNIFMTSGWSQAEQNFTWNNSKSTQLVLPIEPSDQDLVLEASLHPFIVPGKHDSQMVNVFINGNPIDQWMFTEEGEQEKTLIIPNSWTSQGVLSINLEMPDAKSPKELGVSEDARKLAIAIHSISLTAEK